MIHPTPIDALEDPRIAGYRDVRDRDLRRAGERFVVESARCVGRLLRSRFEVESLFCSPRRLEELAPALQATHGVRSEGSVAVDSLPAQRAPRFPIYLADESLIATIAGYHVHGGALALAKRPPWRELAFEVWAERTGVVDRRGEERSPRASAGRRPNAAQTIVALSGVTHMDNVGSIFRSAAGLGIDGILLDERCCDPLLRKPIRVAMGHSLTLPFAWSRDLAADLESLRRLGGWRIAALEEGVEHRAARTLDRLPGRVDVDRLVLLAGNEGHGLERALVDGCDDLIEIPMTEGVPSLNVAVAVAVACWERRRGGGSGAGDGANSA